MPIYNTKAQNKHQKIAEGTNYVANDFGGGTIHYRADGIIQNRELDHQGDGGISHISHDCRSCVFRFCRRIID